MLQTIQALLVIMLIWGNLKICAADLEIIVKPLLSDLKKTCTKIDVLWSYVQAYICIDAVATFANCLALYALTEFFISTTDSNTALVIRWGGIIQLWMYTAVQPLDLLRSIFKGAFQVFSGSSYKKISRSRQDFLQTWINEMRSSADFIEKNILPQILIPYLGFIVIALLLEIFFQKVAISSQNKLYYTLLFFIGDWSAAIMIFMMMMLSLIYELKNRESADETE